MTKKASNNQLTKLQQQIAVEKAKFVSAVRQHVEETLSEFGLQLLDILPSAETATRVSRQAKAPAPVQAKRQAKPATKKSKLTVVSTKKRKPAFKGPQPPKYQDPETGLTWNGFGPAPKWLAGKEREPFLIKAA